MGRGAVLKRFQHVTEPLPGLFHVQPDEPEDLLLDFPPVNPDGSTRNLLTVTDQVVLLAARRAGVGIQKRQVFRHRRSEKVVAGVPAVLVFVPLKEREVYNPAESHRFGVSQAQPLAQVQPQFGKGCRCHRGPVCHEEQKVARPGLHPGDDGLYLLICQEAGKGGANLALSAQGQPGQPGGSLFLDQRSQFVYLTAAVPGTSGRADAFDLPTGCDGLGENPVAASHHQVRDVHQFHPETKVGLIGAVAGHGLGIGKTRKRFGEQMAVGAFLHDADHQFLYERHDVFPGDETHLQVQLGKLRLPVAAQILVPEAAGDLEVPLKPGHHQELLQLLRGLGERVELAGMDAAGNQIVPGALRCALEEDGGFNFQEAASVQEIPDVFDDAVAEDKVALHPPPPQVQVTVLQPQGFVHRGVLKNGEGGRFRRVEDDDFVGQDLNLAGLHAGVDPFGGAGADSTAHLEDVLLADPGSQFVGLGGMGDVGDDLDDAGAVAQVNEDQAAVVSLAVDPPGQGDGLAGVVNAQFAAMMGLEHSTSWEWNELYIKQQAALLLGAAWPLAIGWLTARQERLPPLGRAGPAVIIHNNRTVHLILHC